ncbi:MAG: hypothetical protein HY700_04550 [Gemmatimonadetes bacterium]|nr:hypothetical protein [Gemmatimonadota bacterium]
MQIPTRWRTAFEEQLDDAARRLELAQTHLEQGDGGRALQAAYPAVVAAATVRVWLEHPPWTRPLAASEMQRRARESFPALFAAIASLDLKDVLNSPWQPAAVRPYIEEAQAFVRETRERVNTWLEQG